MFSVLASTFLITTTPLKKRFSEAYYEITNQTNRPGSTKTRKDVWGVTKEIIIENPFLGVGTGDIKDDLKLKYEQKGFQEYIKRGYDSHQQFLQTYASTGLFGFLSLLLVFIICFIRSIKERNYLFFIITTLFFLFGMVESMFERQAGIIFFVFFSMLLYSFNPIKKTIE